MHSESTPNAVFSDAHTHCCVYDKEGNMNSIQRGLARLGFSHPRQEERSAAPCVKMPIYPSSLPWSLRSADLFLLQSGRERFLGAFFSFDIHSISVQRRRDRMGAVAFSRTKQQKQKKEKEISVERRFRSSADTLEVGSRHSFKLTAMLPRRVVPGCGFEKISLADGALVAVFKELSIVRARSASLYLNGRKISTDSPISNVELLAPAKPTRDADNVGFSSIRQSNAAGTYYMGTRLALFFDMLWNSKKTMKCSAFDIRSRCQMISPKSMVFLVVCVPSWDRLFELPEGNF
jgi:hypothetical protein